MDAESSNPRVMKRYLAGMTLSFVAVFAAVWLWVTVAPMAYFDREYPMWLAKMKMIQSRQTFSVVIQGDSRTVAGLIPGRLGRGVVNLAFGGATPVESYYVAQRVVQGSVRPQAIVISQSPLRFMSDEVFWTRAAQFGFLNYGEIEEVRRRSRDLNDDSVCGGASPFDLDTRLKGFLYQVGFPTYRFPSLLGGRIFARYNENKSALDRVLLSRGQAHFGVEDGCLLLDEETGLVDFHPSRLFDDYFDRTLKLYESLNIPVYFLSMPHNEVSVRIYHQQMEQEFSDYLRQYSARYPNFHVLGEVIPVYPAKCFGDADHLNDSGAERWSDTVAKMLNDANVPGGPFGPN
jgi:hypothetical protein